MTIIYGLFTLGFLAFSALTVNHSVNPPANQRADLCYGLEDKYCKEEYKNKGKYKSDYITRAE